MQLGLKPDRLRVFLTKGSDFTPQLELRDGIYATGSTLSLVFDSGPTWTATMDSSTVMTFAIDKAEADGIPHGDGVRLIYTDGTKDQIWALGDVVRYD